MGKNFVFISPTFPKTYYQFPQAWKRIGGTSLCIGEDYYDSLSEEMKNACDEYYRVDNMQDYDQMYRAVAWFAHKHGKIDWLESNNEFWLEQDAKLRTDFNITSGDNETSVMRYKTKSNMKAYYEKANVPVARYHMVSSLSNQTMVLVPMQHGKSKTTNSSKTSTSKTSRHSTSWKNLFQDLLFHLTVS